jgi:O-succinylbenzoate synthase
MTRLRVVELRLVELPLVRPFRTSFGEETSKQAVICRVETDEAEGWGECGASPEPSYSEEFNASVWVLVRDHVAPALFAQGDVRAERVGDALGWIRGHRMAKAMVVNAVLDAELRAAGRPLAEHLGAVRERVACGVSIGIQPTVDALLEQVEGYLAEGYRRIKLKIEPGADVDPVRAVREAHPSIALSVDANAAYSLGDLAVLRALDAFDLLMIEQPLPHEDLVEHAKLQQEIATPVCLDESIRSPSDAAAAIELGACRIVNVKQGRVGGLYEAVRVHDMCRAEEVPVWCGGMLETGIGRATNLALAALPGFTLPGDTSPSRRYFHEDLTEPLEMDADGTMAVPQGAGIGVEPLPERLEAASSRVEVLRPI